MKKAVVLVLLFCVVFSGAFVFAISELSAESAVLLNGSTGTVLYDKNAHKAMPMASTTKIMTAILLLEKADLNQTVLVTEEMVAVEGSSMGLLAGDTVSYKSLLVGLMLASGNDAANTVAIALAGSIPRFVEWMNEKATELRMYNTHFVTPSGLDADGHYSTAYDMAILAAYAMAIPDFAEVVSSSGATVQYGNPPYKRALYNHNKFLNLYNGACGIKTGYTKKSGRCLVTAVRQGGAYLIAVTLNAPNDWEDHKALYDHGLSVLNNQQYTAKCTNSIPVIGGSQPLAAISAKPYSVSLTEQEADKITQHICLPNFVYAPVQAGQNIGYVAYKIEDRIIAQTEIIAEETVDLMNYKSKGFFQKFIANFKKIWI